MNSRDRIASPVGIASISPLALRIAVLVGQTTLTLWLAWVVAPGEFGTYSAALGWASLAATAAYGGSSQTALRIARLLQPHAPRRVTAITLLVRRGHRLGLAFGALAIPTLAWTLGLPWSTAAIAGGLAWALAVHGVLQGTMIASGKVREFLLAEGLFRLPCQLGMLVLLDRWTGALSADTLLMATGFALFPLPALAMSRGDLAPAIALGASARRLRRRLDAFARSTTVNALLYSAFSTSDLLVASLVISPTELAGFALATRASGLLAVLQGTVFDVHAKRLALAIRTSGPHETRRIARSMAMESSGLAVLTLIGVLAALWLPPEMLPATYRAALGPAAILLAGRAVAALFGPMAATLTLTGRHRHLMIITIVAAGFQVLLMVTLGSSWGSKGLAAGSAIALVGLQATLRRASGTGTGRSADIL